MENEQNIIDEQELKTAEVNIWKNLFITISVVALIIFLCIKIYYSDWFINQTLHIKKADNLKLGNHITWEYKNKYDGNMLKMNIKVKNVDEKIFNMSAQYLEDDDFLLLLVFLDKDGFKLAELKIYKANFVKIMNEKGQYGIQTSLLIDKKTVRKITEIDAKYRLVLDMTYKELIKEVQKSMYSNEWY